MLLYLSQVIRIKNNIMKNQKHTPAPWNIEESIAYTFIGETGNRVCMINSLEDGNPDHKANAKLISQSPRMISFISQVYEALEDKSTNESGLTLTEFAWHLECKKILEAIK